MQLLARNPFCCLLNENTCVGFAVTGTRAETCPEHAAFVADYVSSKHENILCHSNRNTFTIGHRCTGVHNGRTVAPEAILFESPCRAHSET